MKTERNSSKSEWVRFWQDRRVGLVLGQVHIYILYCIIAAGCLPSRSYPWRRRGPSASRAISRMEKTVEKFCIPNIYVLQVLNT